jgi:hypothetical protein
MATDYRSRRTIGCASARPREGRFVTTDDTPAPADAAPAPEHGYDVFLSYNSSDRAAVLEIATRLRDAGVHPFLDVWQLVPGEVWQEKLEETLQQCGSCAVFFGPEGLGPWQNEEMRTALSRRVGNTDFRVVPVLLPQANLPGGKLPPFVSRTTRVDFRPGLDDADAFDRLLSGIRGVAPQAEGEDKDLEIECPFRGLEVFDEDHARFFFGREALTTHLVDQLREDRFLAVLGPSGSGKSSVVRAGLIPDLRDGVLPGSAEWPVVIVRPGTDPMDALATQLVQLTGTNGDAIGTQASIRDALSRDAHGLDTVVRLAIGGSDASGGVAQSAVSVDHRVVIVIDQFEELFTLLTDDKARDAFVSALLNASAVPGGPTVVVLTMRADFFGKCAALPGLARRMSERDVLVPPMTESELRDSMIKPADLVGLQFEKGLVDAILDDLGNEPGSLPLLQHTLLELFNGRHGRWLTTDRYNAIGRVKGAILSRAERIYEQLTPEQQTAARRVLLRLTQPGSGTEDTRRRAARTELTASSQGGTAAEAVIERFAEARLLTTDESSTGEEIVDVAHEALIRGWPRLQQWVDENPTALRVHRELTEAAEKWDHQGRKRGYLYSGPRLDEAKALASRYGDDLNDLELGFLKASLGARQRRVILAGGAVALVSATLAVLGIFSLIQGQLAREAAGKAAANALLSDSKVIAPASPPLAQRLAIEALVRGEELGMDRKQLVDNASAMVGSGRYAHLPRPIDQAWTDPAGRVVVGNRTGSVSPVFSTTQGRLIGELEKDLIDVRFSGAPDARVFVAEYESGAMELRRLDDAGFVQAPAKFGAVAMGPGPGGRFVVVSYGDRGDERFEFNRPAEVRSIVDGSEKRKLAGPANVYSLPSDGAGLALVSYHAGDFEVIDLADGEPVLSEDTPPGSVMVNEVLPAFLRIDEDGCTLWSVEPRGKVDLGAASCADALFSDDGRRLEIQTDTTLDVVAVDQPKPLLHLDGYWFIEATSPESPPRFLVIGSEEKTRLYSTGDREFVATFDDLASSDDYGTGPEFSKDGSLAYLPMETSAVLLSTSTGEVLLEGTRSIDEGEEFAVPPQGLSSLEFSADGQWMLVTLDEVAELRRTDDPARPGAEVGEGPAQFWPSSEGALIITASGLLRADANGNLETLRDDPSVEMSVNNFLIRDESLVGIATFAGTSGTVPPTSLLTPDGKLHELTGVDTGNVEFSGDVQNAFVLVDDGSGRLQLWDRTSTPRLLGGLDAYTVPAWDPAGRWLVTASASGDANLVNVDWLRSMADTGPSLDTDWLEQQVCSGPPRDIVDDAALTERLGEAPHSCRTP